MPDLLFPAQGRAGHTAVMGKRKRTTDAKPKARPRPGARPAAEVREPLDLSHVIAQQRPTAQKLWPTLTEAERLQALDPMRGVDPEKRLAEALELVGIDPRLAAQPDAFWLDSWRHGVHILTEHAELVALAVAHAEDARACARGDMPSKALRDDVLCTAYLQRNRKPPEGLQDDRRALVMDGEVITLVQPGDDARAVPITVKLPRVIVERLRDAVHAMAPARTISGIAAMGITMVLDLLEAEHIKNTGHGFPKLGGKLLEGGRPSRTRATTAEPSGPRTKPRKQAKSSQ